MATIFCFTSTGNSLYAAKKIAEIIGGNVAPMRGGPADCGDDVVGFVFPVYFWGLPRMVERFVREIRIANKDAYVFAVANYGGFVYGALERVRALLKASGVRLSYGKNLKMVENYIPRYKVNDSEAFREKIDGDILKIADAVQRGAANRVHAFAFVANLSHRFYPNENSDRYFSVSSACTGCGACKAVCPAGNIALPSGRPAFKHNCEHCLACLQHCPIRAIDWRGKTNEKDRYRNSGVPLNELIAFNKGGLS